MSVRRGRLPVALWVLLLVGGWSLASAGPGLAQPAPTTTVHIVAAPGGSGSSCAPSHPCSIWTAQSVAQRHAGQADVDVELQGGTYHLSHPLVFSSADSGTSTHPVLYRAAAGSHPVLSGGIPVTGWSKSAGGRWEGHVPAGTQSRELYAGGQRLVRASGSPPGEWVQTAQGFFTTDTAMASWPDASNMELDFSEGNGFWTEPRCGVASVQATTGGTDVTVRQPCWSNLSIPDTPADLTDPQHANGDNAMGGFEGLTKASTPSTVENTLELLTTAGQWYLDSATGTVYYMAKAGENPAQETFVMPVQQALVEGDGTLADPVHDLTLEGLTFAYTTWLQPSSDEGFAEMQANFTLTGVNASGSVSGSTVPPEGTCQYTVPAGTCPFAAWTEEPAAVTFRASHSVRIVDDTFTHLGAAGLNILYGSQNDLVQGNEIYDTSGSGIQLGSDNDAQPIGGDRREIVSGNTIVDNWVHNVAAEYEGGVGIWVGYTQGTTLAHNQIDDTPYTAISFGWGGWHTDTLHPDNPSDVGDNHITDNLIYNYLETVPDGGAIYTNGTQGPPDPSGPATDPFLTPSTSAAQMAKGLTITGNVALIATWSEFAYYNDEGSDYVTYADNVEYQAHAFATGGCNTVGHILFSGNYFAQPVGGYICPPPPVDIQFTSHHILPDHPGPGDIPISILSGAGLEPGFRWLVTARPPEVTGIGPQAGPTPAYPSVLVSGSGFQPGMAVYFGSVPSPSVTVLSANYLTAAPPAGVTGQVDITVKTPAGTSAISSADQYVELP